MSNRVAHRPENTGPSPEASERLARLVAAYTPGEGRFELRREGVYAVRWSHITHEPLYSTKGPALCVIAQGKKVMMLGRETFDYDRTRMVANWVDLPIAGQVVDATPERPFLAVKIDLDPGKVAELAFRVYPHGTPDAANNRGFSVGPATEGIVVATARLLELMDDPVDAELLAPLAIEEVLIRLLRSSMGGSLALVGQAGSGTHRVARVVSWMRTNLAQPTTIEQLARLGHMSVSAFYQRFKAVTALSPLQYHKVLRLHEARRLMLFQSMDASGAAREVGYASASQFSREYARLFGTAPMKDVARLREAAVGQTRPRRAG
jgi:AraC-like DNA-binding protein